MNSANRIDLFSCAGVPSGSFTGRYFNLLANKSYFRERIIAPFDASRTCFSHVMHRIYIVFQRTLATLTAIGTTVLDCLWTLKMIAWRNSATFEMGLYPDQRPYQHILLNVIRLWALLLGTVPTVMPRAEPPPVIPPDPQLDPFLSPTQLNPHVDYLLSTDSVTPLSAFIFSADLSRDLESATKIIRFIFAGAIFEQQALQEVAEWFPKVVELLLGSGRKDEKYVAIVSLLGMLDPPSTPPLTILDEFDVDESERKIKEVSEKERSHLVLDRRWNLRCEIKLKIIDVQGFLNDQGRLPLLSPHRDSLPRMLFNFTTLLMDSDLFRRATSLAWQKRIKILTETPYGERVPRGIVTLTALFWNGFLEPSPDEISGLLKAHADSLPAL